MRARGAGWILGGLRSLAALLLLLVIAAPAGPLAGVTIDGPEAVAVGDSIELVASGVPAGGTYRWLIDGRRGKRAGRRAHGLPDPRVALRPDGERARVSGVAPSAHRRDVELTVLYTVGGQTVSATHRVTVASGDLTAHRPQLGAGYVPLARRAVADVDEMHPQLGPGIRINGPGDSDPSGEDDLIELRVDAVPPNVPLVLHRGGTQLSVWTTRDKAPGSELAFGGSTTGPLPFGGAASTTVWVEWSAGTHGTSTLELRAPGGDVAVDRVRFHTFQSVVFALGGEGQVPIVPTDPNHGTFVVGEFLYERGYDVHTHDEDDVGPLGDGPVYDEVVTAVQDRAVSQVVSFGYSHGGGSTYDLVERIMDDQVSIGSFTVPFTSYVDGVGNASDIDTSQELRHPPGSALHVNHYQRGSFADFFLDGGPVPSSIPGTTGLDVETTPWGAGTTHYLVDDFAQVRDLIQAELEQSVNR